MWTITRLADGPDGTLGLMENAAGRSFYVLEEEDQGNRSNVSRIPAGTYTCKRSRYYKGGYETFEVTGVPGRSRILFHVGNTEEDVSGCVALGTGVSALRVKDEDGGQQRRKLAVTNSSFAFKMFMEANRGLDTFTLRVLDPGEAT